MSAYGRLNDDEAQVAHINLRKKGSVTSCRSGGGGGGCGVGGGGGGGGEDN